MIGWLAGGCSTLDIAIIKICFQPTLWARISVAHM